VGSEFGSEKIPGKWASWLSLSDVLAHECRRETLENKVSLINAQNTLNPLLELKVRGNR
jgi:hypothetical protein